MVSLLTGSGSKAFAAGADISEFANFSEDEATNMSADGHEVMNTIEEGTKPVIAAVNGFALGGGCELAMACHLRLASPNAKFGQPEVNLGVPPGYGGTQRLVQLIGKGRAMHMLITGDAIDAQKGRRIWLGQRGGGARTIIGKSQRDFEEGGKKEPKCSSQGIQMYQ